MDVGAVITVRVAMAEDAASLAPRLRAADAREIAAAVGGDPAVVLATGVARSAPCFAVVDDDLVVGLFGVVPGADDPTAGLVWLVGADALVRSPRRFVRDARVWLAALEARYAVLWSLVDARNEAHLRWLRGMGFAFVGLVPRHGVEGRPFHHVERLAADGWPPLDSAQKPSGAC